MVDGVVVSGWLMEGPGVFSWSGEDKGQHFTLSRAQFILLFIRSRVQKVDRSLNCWEDLLPRLHRSFTLCL